MKKPSLTIAELERLAHDAIVDLVEKHDLKLKIADAPGAQIGTVARDIQFRIFSNDDTKPRLIMSRPRHRRGAHDGTIIDRAIATGPTAAESIASVVNRLFDPYIRLVHRDRQFVAAGLDIFDGIHSAPAPAWGYAINPVVLARLTADGLTPDAITRMTLEDMRAMVNDRPTSKYHLFLDEARITLRRTELSPTVFYDELKAIPRLWINQRLPSTVLGGLLGRQVRDVVSHPWLEGVDAVITAVRDKTNDDPNYGAGVVELELFIPDVLVGPLPHGIGDPWHLSHLRHGPRRR